ncbi:metallophosphoesterase [Marinilabiliaceae bacterium JC017]|nr:metallophosphoesterase [Marinilabiliaceae bacterium JC017]
MKYICLSLLLAVFTFWGCTHQKKDKCRIAFLTDIHVQPGNAHETALCQVIEEINNGNFDFVTITGDLSNMGSDAELMAVKKALDGLTIPYHIIPGNHEYNWSESGGATYEKIWGADRFKFSFGNYNFVGYNCGPYMKMGDGHVKQQDLIWLSSALSQLDNEHGYTISMAHYPLDANLDNWPDVTKILKENNVNISFCGHGHRLKLMNFDGISGVMGRALIGRQADDIGYNIIDLKGDSVFVSEKLLGQESQRKFTLSLSNTSVTDTLVASPQPDYSMNDKYGITTSWDYQDVASVNGGVALHHRGAVIWGTSTGEIKAFDKKTKVMMWQKKVGNNIYSTPVIYKDLVIFGTPQGKVIALNVINGDQVWENTVNYPVFSEGAIDGEYLFMGCGKGGMYKMEAATGKVIWQYNQVGGFVQAKACVTNHEVIFGAWDKYLYCLNKQTGKLNWKWTNGHGAILYSPGNVVPVVAHNKVFIVAPDRHFTVIDLATGKQLYRTNGHKVRESMGLSLDKELVYAKLMNDSLVAFPTRNFDKGAKWVADCGFGYEHNPCPMVEVGDMVIGGTRNGVVFALDKATKNIRWKKKLGNSEVNKITIDADNKIWVTLMEGIIARIE